MTIKDARRWGNSPPKPKMTWVRVTTDNVKLREYRQTHPDKSPLLAGSEIPVTNDETAAELVRLGLAEVIPARECPTFIRTTRRPTTRR